MMIPVRSEPARAAIEVRNLHRVFSLSGNKSKTPRELKAVDGVSFSVNFGDVLGIVGESGCGKSTLARLILGLMSPSSGEVVVDGKDLATLDRKERARLVQPIFQDPFSSLNPTQRIRDIVGLPLKVQGDVSASAIQERVMSMLERVGLPANMAERYPAQMSGGQRQRVAIARALVLKPRIIICDEPTSALDVSVQAQILNLLAELRRELGLTLVFISHNLAVVEHVATDVAVMYLGRIVEQAPSEQLFRSASHPYTRALLASVLTPEPGKGLPDVALGDSYPDPSNVPAGCRFHPRCSQAFADCKLIAPQLVGVGEGGVECHLYRTPRSEATAAAGS